MTGSLVFEEAPFAFPGRSIGTPDLPAKLHMNDREQYGVQPYIGLIMYLMRQKNILYERCSI
jgi:hypothetical protein